MPVTEGAARDIAIGKHPLKNLSSGVGREENVNLVITQIDTNR